MKDFIGEWLVRLNLKNAHTYSKKHPEGATCVIYSRRFWKQNHGTIPLGRCTPIEHKTIHFVGREK